MADFHKEIGHLTFQGYAANRALLSFRNYLSYLEVRVRPGPNSMLRSHRTFGYGFGVMSFRRVINQLFACLLIIGLLAGSASASNYVWCVSAEGDHAVLEFAPTGDCSQDDCIPATNGVATSGFEADADGCGPCLDVSHSHPWNISRYRQGDAPLDTLAVAPQITPYVCILPDRTLNPDRLVDHPPRIPDQILHHRTTVLLI